MRLRRETGRDRRMSPSVQAGAAENPARPAPERRCILSGETGPRAALIRFVLSPSGEIVPDVAGRLPGRGMWLLAQRPTLEEAARRNPFARVLKRPVSVGADLPGLTESLLLRRCLDFVSLARRAGQATAGYEAVVEALRKVPPGGLLLAARDAGADGRAKLAQFQGSGLRVVAALSAEEIGGIFGRARVVIALIAPGRLADRLVGEGARLAGVRPLAA